MVGALSAAALAVGRTAWHAGQDIEFAVTAAGYSAALARGVYDYFANHATASQEEATQELSQGMAPRIKRARSYGAYSGKRKPPVAKNVKSYVKKCMDRILENKRIDSGTSINPGLAGTVTDLALWGITQGNALNQRIGNNIRLKELQMRLTVNGDTGSTDTDRTRIRVLIVQDKQCNGALPAVTDVLLQANVLSLYNYNNVVGCGGHRFVILKDKTWDFSPNSYYDGATVLNPGQAYTTSWNFTKLPVIQYDANAGAITDLCGQNVFMISVADDSANGLDYKFQWCYLDA